MTIHIPVVEYNVVEHCNLACGHCDHASPRLRPRTITIDDVLRDLTTLGSVLHADEINILGGEPLLRDDLPALLAQVRACGIADRITVVTNGTLLHRVAPAFWQNIDTLRLSIYPGVSRALGLDAVESTCTEYGVAFIPQHMEHFRQTLLDFPIEDADLVEYLRRNCELPTVNHCHTVRGGRYYKCSPAAFVKTRLALLGIEHDDKDDGVTITGNPGLAEDLGGYLASPAPLPACAYCLGTSGRWLEHHQVRERPPAVVLAPPSPWDLLNAGFVRQWKTERGVA